MKSQKLKMADIEVTFPNNKKVKVPSGSALKDAAKKAGFSPKYVHNKLAMFVLKCTFPPSHCLSQSYGCEEGLNVS